MNDKQINEILDLIRVNYRNFYKNETTQEKTMLLKTWKYQFANIPQEIMYNCVMGYMATETSYPPTIAHINKILYGMVVDNVGSAEESFEKIFNLVSRFGSSQRGYDKASKNFTDIESKVLTPSYWKELGLDESPRSVIKGQYCRHYNSVNENVSLQGLKQISKIEERELLMKINNQNLLGGKK